MRVIGWICIGFFIYYVIDSGGPREAVNSIAGEVYWATMPAPIGTDIDDVQDSIEKTLEDLRKEVDKF